MVEKYEMVATTLMGLESTLAEEIKNLGGENITPLRRAVKFFGDDSTLYKANMSLRTALRILVPIDEFFAEDEDELYRKIKDIYWEDVFSINQTFMITAVTSGMQFRHSKYAALKTKDAIADRFRSVYGKRPSVDTEDPDFYIHILIANRKVVVSIDSSGLSLDRRGYRRWANEAPINEILAAGIILMSGWKPHQPLLDPMSGSGTFSIEAAMIGTQTPPNFNRRFAFQNWADFDADLFEKVRFELKKRMREDLVLNIYTRDISPANIDIIAQNAANAGVEDHISLKKEDFFESETKLNDGVIFINPPYGERLKLENTELFYENMGEVFKNKFSGSKAWVISSDYKALNAIYMKPSFKQEMMNGGLKVMLVQYEMYKPLKEK